MSYEVKAQMPSKVIAINVNPGDDVTAATEIITVESMKMEMPITADVDGVIEAINTEVGATVPKDFVLATIESK